MLCLVQCFPDLAQHYRVLQGVILLPHCSTWYKSSHWTALQLETPLYNQTWRTWDVRRFRPLFTSFFMWPFKNHPAKKQRTGGKTSLCKLVVKNSYLASFLSKCSWKKVPWLIQIKECRQKHHLVIKIQLDHFSVTKRFPSVKSTRQAKTRL